MRAFFLGFIPFCIFALGARWFYVCEMHYLCGGENPTIEETIKERPKTLTLNDGKDTILKDYEQFGFRKNTHEPILTDDNRRFLNELAGYLESEPDKHITITGNYLKAEKDVKPKGLFYENLGLARADTIREILKRKGIDEDRFAFEYDMVDSDQLYEPLTFNLFNSKKTSQNVKSDGDGKTAPLTKLKFTFTDMTYSDANFEYDSDVFRPGEQLKLYADSVKTYLALNPDKTLTVIGHTDDKGSRAYNKGLGKRRAENAKIYFENLGVEKSIQTVSMGEAQPVSSNATDDGRQRNRRVNFRID